MNHTEVKMNYAMDIVEIGGIEYIADFNRKQFKNLLQPEIIVPFESEKGKAMCALLGIKKCNTCGRYVSTYEVHCTYCEHMLMCE